MIWLLVDRFRRRRPRLVRVPWRGRLIGRSLDERIAYRRAWRAVNEVEMAAGLPPSQRPKDMR
jgi:hypothetical protein